MIRKLLDRLTAAAVAFACASAFCQAAPVIAEEGAAAEETTVSDTAGESEATTSENGLSMSTVTVVHTAEISDHDYEPTDWWKADLEEYDEMMKLVSEAGIVCQIELEMHYNPVVHRMKELFAKESLGRVSAFNATNITLSPVWAFPWQGDPNISYGKSIPLKPGDNRCRGGALSDHPHIFDMLRWVTNSDYDYVYADVADNIRDIKEEDVVYVTGRMKNGCKFLLDPSWSRHEAKTKVPINWDLHPKRMEVNFSIVGTEGVIQADCFGPNDSYCGGPNNRYAVQYTYFDEWIGMMDEFCDCILNNKQPKINLQWHRQTVEAMVKCYESIYTGKPVYLNK